MKSTNRLFKTCVKQPVKIRKYEVNIPKLQQCLRSFKKASKLSIKDINEALGVPKTLAEHWFRTDKCFAIPTPNLWLPLKELLQIETDEFDESIMTFIEQDGKFEMAERCYYDFGIAPTVTTGGDINIIVGAEYDDSVDYDE